MISRTIIHVADLCVSIDQLRTDINEAIMQPADKIIHYTKVSKNCIEY